MEFVDDIAIDEDRVKRNQREAAGGIIGPRCRERTGNGVFPVRGEIIPDRVGLTDTGEETKRQNQNDDPHDDVPLLTDGLK